MWYTYLNREQAYLRSYRTHNLWLDQYQKTIRTPRAHPFHMQVFKRLAKSYSGVSQILTPTMGNFIFCGRIIFRYHPQAGSLLLLELGPNLTVNHTFLL